LEQHSDNWFAQNHQTQCRRNRDELPTIRTENVSVFFSSRVVVCGRPWCDIIAESRSLPQIAYPPSTSSINGGRARTEPSTSAGGMMPRLQSTYHEKVDLPMPIPEKPRNHQSGHAANSWVRKRDPEIKRHSLLYEQRNLHQKLANAPPTSTPTASAIAGCGSNADESIENKINRQIQSTGAPRAIRKCENSSESPSPGRKRMKICSGK